MLKTQRAQAIEIKSKNISGPSVENMETKEPEWVSTRITGKNSYEHIFDNGDCYVYEIQPDGSTQCCKTKISPKELIKLTTELEDTTEAFQKFMQSKEQYK